MDSVRGGDLSRVVSVPDDRWSRNVGIGLGEPNLGLDSGAGLKKRWRQDTRTQGQKHIEKLGR